MSNRNFGRLHILRMAGLSSVLLLAANVATAQTCTLKNNDREWIERALERWQTVSRDSLRLKPAPLPWIVLFDETCVWHVNPDLSISTPKLPDDSDKMKLSFSRKPLDVYGTIHKGEITLPDNEKIPIQSPAQLIAFTSAYRNGQKPFFVFSMPAVWRQAPHLKTQTNLEVAIRSIFVHEMTHTRHRNFFGQIGRIEKLYKFSEEFSDDIIQDHFGKREEFRKAYETERDFLYQAVSETDRRRKRDLAKKALDSIRSRHKQFFSGEDAHYAEIESIFLTMEGVAGWAAYKSVMGEGVNRAAAIELIRGRRKYWVQDEGLALFLVIDSLLPNWQKRTFAEPAISVTDLLSEAVNRK